MRSNGKRHFLDTKATIAMSAILPRYARDGRLVGKPSEIAESINQNQSESTAIGREIAVANVKSIAKALGIAIPGSSKTGFQSRLHRVELTLDGLSPGWRDR